MLPLRTRQMMSITQTKGTPTIRMTMARITPTILFLSRLLISLIMFQKISRQGSARMILAIKGRSFTVLIRFFIEILQSNIFAMFALLLYYKLQILSNLFAIFFLSSLQNQYKLGFMSMQKTKEISQTP